MKGFANCFSVAKGKFRQTMMKAFSLKVLSSVLSIKQKSLTMLFYILDKVNAKIWKLKKRVVIMEPLNVIPLN